MKLIDKLGSIKTNEIIDEFDKMLKGAKVSISYTGQRLIEVDGFEDTVTINEFANKFLETDVLRTRRHPQTLERRLQCNDMWDRIQSLYAESNKQLAQFSYVTQTLTFGREFRLHCRACAGDPQAIIGEWGHSRYGVFEFTPGQFKELFGDVEPKGHSYSSDKENREMWLADKDMVMSASAKRSKAEARATLV